MNVFEPTPEMISIEDIAHSLSNQCRFGGHLPRFYSVAEHSVLCALHVDEKYAFEALMHDASEAYLLDIPSPIKHGLSNYKVLEDKVMHCIAKKFGFMWPMIEPVRVVDKVMVEAEWEHIMLKKYNSDVIRCFSPDAAKIVFMQAFNKYKPKN